MVHLWFTDAGVTATRGPERNFGFHLSSATDRWRHQQRKEMRLITGCIEHLGQAEDLNFTLEARAATGVFGKGLTVSELKGDT